MSGNITLVGFSGAGKSVLGKKISAATGKDFVDLDTAIEERFRTSVELLFAKYGEYGFRKCEAQVLREALAMDNCVVATGGGAPCSLEAMQHINSHSTSIFLELPEDILFRNLRTSRKRRPLTDNMTNTQLREYIHATLEKRLPYYNMAHFTLHSDNGDFQVSKALELLG